MAAIEERRNRDDPDNDAPRKYYVDGGHFEIAAHYVSELDPDGKQLRVIKFTDYAAEKVRILYPNGLCIEGKMGRPGAEGGDHGCPGGTGH